MDAQEEIPVTYSHVFTVVVKAFKSFLRPLAVIAIAFAFLTVCFGYVRQVILDPPRDIMISISMINSYDHYPILVHGLKYKPKLQGRVDLHLLNLSGCNILDFQNLNAVKSQQSIIMIAPGSCSLHSRIENAKQSGFLSVLLYNDMPPYVFQNLSHLEDLDMIILSADSVNSRSIRMLMSNKAVCSAVLKSNLVDFLNLSTLFVEIALNLIVVYLAEFVVLTAWLITYTLVNIVLHRNFRIRQSIIDGCFEIMENVQSIKVPKLQHIPFPEKTLNERNIEELKSFQGTFESDVSSYHDSCGICLEEFQVRNKVRSLPYRWLLDYNRLCPTCQQDVLKSGPIGNQSNTADRSSSDSDLEESLVSRPRGNSIKARIARWIQRRLA